MKKIFCFLIASVMLLSLASCGNNQETADDSTAETVYGTATLTYAEFYEGDVSSTDSFDSVSSATNTKHSTFPNVATDFTDEETNADGYHLTGVKNVNIAISKDDCDAYKAINPTFELSDGEVPAQYKTVTIENGKAVYSPTKFNVADTVKDAKAELHTGTVWGDYQINVIDGEKVHLRNTRDDEFDVNSNIQGIILETSSGLKVGMEALQSIWVQTYEVSFNVPDDNTHNTHIAAYDNLAELSKLVGETVTKITYIMPDSVYVYEFEGIYIKPIYKDSITATLEDDEIRLSTDNFEDFKNGKLTVSYKTGSGRGATNYTLAEASISNGTSAYAVDPSVIADAEKGGIYSATISSDTYADVTVKIPMSAEQKTALENIIKDARAKLEENPENAVTVTEHIEEAQELLADNNSSSADAGSLISEITELIAEKTR